MDVGLRGHAFPGHSFSSSMFFSLGKVAVPIVVLALELWLAFGLLFGFVFVFFGIGHVHEGARGAGVGARLVLVPGCAIFWPWLLYLWVRRRSVPIECTNHRCAVPGGDG